MTSQGGKGGEKANPDIKGNNISVAIAVVAFILHHVASHSRQRENYKM